MNGLEGKQTADRALDAWRERFGINSILFAVAKNANTNKLALANSIDLLNSKGQSKQDLRKNLEKLYRQQDHYIGHLTLLNELIKILPSNKKTIKLEQLILAVNDSNTLKINNYTTQLNSLVAVEPQRFVAALLSFFGSFYKKLVLSVSARRRGNRVVLKLTKANNSSFGDQLSSALQEYNYSKLPKLTQLDNLVAFLSLEILTSMGCYLKLAKDKKSFRLYIPASSQLNVFDKKYVR